MLKVKSNRCRKASPISSEVQGEMKQTAIYHFSPPVFRSRWMELLAGALLLTLTACSGIYPLTIEVLEPTPTSLPGNVNRVIVVNNTVPQPNYAGIRRVYKDSLVSEYELDMDSLSWIALEALCIALDDAHFFDRISFFRQPVRKDSEWIAGIPLPEAFRNEIFDTYGYDAIVSIDRLLFALEAEAKYNALESTGNYTHVWVDNRVTADIRYSVYLYGKPEPAFSFSLTDSIKDKNTIVVNSLDFLKTLPESMMEDLAYRLGEKLAYSILPAWTEQGRVIYTESDSRIQEAFSYSKNGKWEQAASLWLISFDRESQNAGKAKLANNIAVANEMQDKLDAALRWAEKARKYLPENSKERGWANEYVSLLQQRIQNNRILDLQ
jgi:hypothetical protein